MDSQKNLNSEAEMKAKAFEQFISNPENLTPEMIERLNWMVNSDPNNLATEIDADLIKNEYDLNKCFERRNVPIIEELNKRIKLIEEKADEALRDHNYYNDHFLVHDGRVIDKRIDEGITILQRMTLVAIDSGKDLSVLELVVEDKNNTVSVSELVMSMNLAFVNLTTEGVMELRYLKDVLQRLKEIKVNLDNLGRFADIAYLKRSDAKVVEADLPF